VTNKIVGSGLTWQSTMNDGGLLENEKLANAEIPSSSNEVPRNPITVTTPRREQEVAAVRTMGLMFVHT